MLGSEGLNSHSISCDARKKVYQTHQLIYGQAYLVIINFSHFSLFFNTITFPVTFCGILQRWGISGQGKNSVAGSVVDRAVGSKAVGRGQATGVRVFGDNSPVWVHGQFRLVHHVHGLWTKDTAVADSGGALHALQKRCCVLYWNKFNLNDIKWPN